MTCILLFGLAVFWSAHFFMKSLDDDDDDDDRLNMACARIERLEQQVKSLQMAAPRGIPKTGQAPSADTTRKGHLKVNEHIIQFFAYEHLPAHLQDVSRPFCEMAKVIVDTIPRNPERTVALRKLLESKDAAVRALLAKEVVNG